MVSPELLRRYPFFAGLSLDQIAQLAQLAEEVRFAAGDTIFHEGDELQRFYLLMEGAVAIVMELPGRGLTHAVSDQLLRTMATEDVIVANVGPGDVFGWSALLPPHKATSGGRALAACRVLAFDAQALNALFADDPAFAYLMTQKAAGVIRDRLHDMRIESLAHMAA